MVYVKRNCIHCESKTHETVEYEVVLSLEGATTLTGGAI